MSELTKIMKPHLPINLFIQKFCQIRDSHANNSHEFIRAVASSLGLSQIEYADIDLYVRNQLTCKSLYEKGIEQITPSLFSLIIAAHFIEIENGNLKRAEVQAHALVRYLDTVRTNFIELTLGRIIVFEFLMLYATHGVAPMYPDNGFGTTRQH